MILAAFAAQKLHLKTPWCVQVERFTQQRRKNFSVVVRTICVLLVIAEVAVILKAMFVPVAQAWLSFREEARTVPDL